MVAKQINFYLSLIGMGNVGILFMSADKECICPSQYTYCDSQHLVAILCSAYETQNAIQSIEVSLVLNVLAAILATPTKTFSFLFDLYSQLRVLTTRGLD